MKNKIVAAVAALAGVGGLAAVPTAAIAGTSCPSGTAVAAYCTSVGPTKITTPVSIGWTTTTPVVSVKVVVAASAPKLVSVVVKLPKGITFVPAVVKKSKVVASQKSIKATTTALTVALKKGTSSVSITLKKGTIKLSTALKKQIAAKKLKVVKFVVDVKNTKGKITKVTVSVKV